jgi:4-amino-4-deoxy-L-arabinose transferase-like glycosyltransferase
MFAILPLLSLILLSLIFYKRGNCWRSSILLSAVSWGVLVTFSTELLSIFRELTFEGLLTFWLLVDLVLPLIYVKSVKTKRVVREFNLSSPRSPFQNALIGSIFAIVAAIGFIALIAPPNNWDSMTYHLGRIVHWMQDRSIAHYPTHILRQLYSGPWPGFTLTLLYVLGEGDQLLNLMQWFSMTGSIIGVSLIAEQLGGDQRAQIFAATVCATIPMGILQGSSTQTDYVTAFWLVCFVYFTLSTIQSRISWNSVLAMSASLGLAFLTKVTGYIYAFPFCLWLFFSGIRQLGWRVWKPMLMTAVIVVSLNIGQWWRNLELFGSLFGPTGQSAKVFSIPIVLSNIIRNLALHLSTPVRSINLGTIQVIKLIHQLLGVDVSDPRITSPPGQKFDLLSLINHEDQAGNLIHLLLLTVCIVFFVLRGSQLRNRTQSLLGTYLIAVVSGFLLFCILVVWSPWRSRLHLSVFVLASAFIGVVMSDLIKRKIANTIAVGVVTLSLIWVLFNESRPLLMNSQIVESRKVENIFNTRRADQYFINRPNIEGDYLSAVDFLKSQSCSQVGLIIGGDTWEYPLWKFGKDAFQRPMQIEHINVDNGSAIKTALYPHRDFIPCAILTTKPSEAQLQTISFKNKTYQHSWVKGGINIFLTHKPV